MTVLNLQDAFNLAYMGLKSQGFTRSMFHSNEDREICAYRGETGRKCAVGHCIPDELYNTAFENERAPVVLNKLANRGHKLIDNSVVMSMNILQTCHDWAENPKDMESRLMIFAEDKGLTIPE